MRRTLISRAPEQAIEELPRQQLLSTPLRTRNARVLVIANLILDVIEESEREGK